MNQYQDMTITEEEWLEHQYENYIEETIDLIECREDKIESELERLIAQNSNISQQN